jgi:hypothetical protein
MMLETNKTAVARAGHNTPQAANSEFLRAIYGELEVGTHGWVCSFRADPSNATADVWAGRAYSGSPAQAQLLDRAEDDNSYYCPAILDASSGKVSRTKANFTRLAALVVDDVQLGDLEGVPTYVLETSPGKFQVGVKIDPVDPDASNPGLVDAVMGRLSKREGNDRSGNACVRFVRLPNGSNTKPRASGPFRVRLQQWNPGQEMDLADACALFGLDLDSINMQASATPTAYQADPALRSLDGIAEGGRDEGLFKYACSLRARDFDHAEAQVLVLHRAAQCVPAFPPAEALKCLAQAWKHPPGKSEAFRKAPEVDPETGEIVQPRARMLECFKASSLPPASNGEVFDDELVEGVMGKAAMAVLYGDSNSGKTFLAIDLCAAIARGAKWLGRHTEPGVVLYLATESPHSVKVRLRAYQRHHRVKLDWFYVVASPVSLFNAQADMQAVMSTVQRVEQETGARVSLIVGDTLARLSAGANENSGEDMGVVLQNCDRIRDASGATFLLIHHTGKDAAKGMRGWSGMRAHIDTEVEVTADEDTGQRCAEITKQRDLDGKGDRYGFTLEAISVGVNKWGRPRSSCIVMPSEAPAKKNSKAAKMGPVEASVLKHLRELQAGVYISKVVSHFEAQQVPRSSVYRAIDALNIKGMAHVAEATRMVCVAEAFR